MSKEITTTITFRVSKPHSVASHLVTNLPYAGERFWDIKNLTESYIESAASKDNNGLSESTELQLDFGPDGLSIDAIKRGDSVAVDFELRGFDTYSKNPYLLTVGFEAVSVSQTTDFDDDGDDTVVHRVHTSYEIEKGWLTAEIIANLATEACNYYGCREDLDLSFFRDELEAAGWINSGDMPEWLDPATLRPAEENNEE